jgi:membrane-associated phospholipid phosphatase
MPVRRAAPALIAAVGTAVALVAVRATAFGSGAGHRLDASGLVGFLGLERPATEPIAARLAHLADPLEFALFGAALVLVALARGRPRAAAAVPVILLTANATTQALKPLLAHPRVCDCLGDYRVAAASWPSGHATAAMSLALCAVLVAPPRLRPTAAVAGAAFAIAVSFGLLVLGWHYPSDVLAGYGVAALYTLLAVAALRAASARWPERTGRDAAARWVQLAAPLATAAGFAAVLAASVVLARPHAVADYAASHTTFVFVAGGLAAAAMAVAGTFAAALRR